MKIKQSKNNPDKRIEKIKGHWALELDCQKCQTKCTKGIRYIEKFKTKLQGNGVWCEK